jgi:hypothetical protein
MSNITSTCKIGERLLAEFLAALAQAHALSGRAHAESDARGLFGYLEIDDDSTPAELDHFAGRFAFDLFVKLEDDFLPRLIGALPSLRPGRAAVETSMEEYDEDLDKMVLTMITVEIDLPGLIVPPRPERSSRSST